MDYSAMPRIVKSREDLEKGIPAFELLYEAQLCTSKAEARRLISQGGGYVNNEQIKAFDEKIGLGHLRETENTAAQRKEEVLAGRNKVG